MRAGNIKLLKKILSSGCKRNVRKLSELEAILKKVRFNFASKLGSTNFTATAKQVIATVIEFISRGLKIPVSLVRFRVWAPLKTLTTVVISIFAGCLLLFVISLILLLTPVYTCIHLVKRGSKRTSKF